MAIVPNYKRSARLTPRYQRNIEVSASAEHMGAAIGRGLKGLGQGIGTAGKALHAAARLDNAKAQAKERQQQDQMAERERQTRVKNQLSDSMEKNRADIQKIAQDPEAYANDPDLKDFGSTVDDMRRVEGFLKTAPKDEADNIRPGIEAIHVNASNRANQLRQEQTLIASQQADERYLDNFVQEAVTDRNDPAAVEKYRLAGLANIRASAERDGLDDTEATALAHAYSSKLDKEVVLAKLEDDPTIALGDYDQLRPRLVETDRQELDRTFSFVRKDEEVKSQISGILSLRRHEASLSAARQTSNPSTTPELQQVSISETESDQPSGNPVPFSYLNAASPVTDRALDQDLTPTFATNLDAMMEDAPQNIRDGLEILTDLDRMPIKPGAESDYWSGQQGQRKVRIRYQGQSLSKAPLPVRDWLADNAESYGLFMPVGSTTADNKSPEERIADGFDTFLVSSLDSPASRTLGPSAKQMEEAIAAIDNPDLQEAARANLQIELDRRSKQDKAGQLAAAREIWAALDNGKSLEDVPISIRVAAGSATIADATDFIRAREGGKIIQTDAVTLSELNRMMALTPDRFAGQDLDAYRNQISRNDLKELKQHQTDLLKQDGQALKRTGIYKATFEQADQLLHQLGLSTTGPNGEIDPEAAKLNAQFFVNLKNRVDYELDRNEGQGLNGIQIHDLIKKQLQTDFPDQAADLQALQDVSSSVSTNSGLLGHGARAAPPVMSSKPRSPKIELPEWMQIGKAILPILEKLMFGNWDRINESHKLGDGRKVTIAGYGHEDKASRTITIEDINGQTMVLTGEQILGSDDGNQTPLLALTGGSVNGRDLSASELQSFSEALTFAGVRTVLNSDVNEDGEEGERPPPGIGDNSIPSGVEPIDEEQPTEEHGIDEVSPPETGVEAPETSKDDATGFDAENTETSADKQKKKHSENGDKEPPQFPDSPLVPSKNKTGEITAQKNEGKPQNNPNDEKRADEQSSHSSLRSKSDETGVDQKDTSKKPLLRRQYIEEVENVKNEVSKMRKRGASVEEMARYASKRRREIGVKYKDLTPPDLQHEIYERNLRDYGDKLGPTIEFLRNEKKKTWEEILESATRTGGEDIDYNR